MKTTIRALLVDDEIPALEVMKDLLSTHPEVEVLGQARSVQEAAALANSTKPDLILLDIQMPREDGFALLPKLTHPSAIIFVTAYDQYAVRAFTVNAVDYLLKPVQPERLEQALARLQRKAPQPLPSSLGFEDNVFLKTDRGLRVARVSSITHIEAEENYTRVHLADGQTHLLRRTMGEWETMLPKDKFTRLERSLLVGLHAVQNLQVQTRDEALLFLSGRTNSISLGRRASLRLRQLLAKD